MPTPQTIQPQQSTPAAQGMTFDAQPVSQPLNVQSAPASSAPSPASSQTGAGDMVFDPAPTQQAAPAVPSALHIAPDDNAALKFAKGADSVGAGIGDGLLDTLNGGADFLGLPHQILQQRQKELEQQNSENPYLNTTGKITDGLAEFISGDEVLKGLAWSDRLLKTAKIAKVFEDSPRLLQALQIGANALRSGAVQGGITTIKTGGDFHEGAEQALLAGGLTGAFGAAGPALKAIRAPFSLQAVQDALESSHGDIHKALATTTKAIQDDWHDTVRGIFNNAAKSADVTPAPAQSLHDVAANVSDAIKAKAQGLYRQADQALGGTRFQSFQDSVRNIQRAIREEVGLDPAQDKILEGRLQDAQAAHSAAKEQLAADGHDPGIVDKADALWKQAMALSDVSKPIQASISGLRADLQNGASAATESLSPAKLAGRLNRLYNSGRLQQAIGDDGSAKLLQSGAETQQRLQQAADAAKQQAEAAKVRASQQAEAVKNRRTVATVGAGAAAGGGVSAYAILKHMLGL